jgi:hypothetical protein
LVLAGLMLGLSVGSPVRAAAPSADGGTAVVTAGRTPVPHITPARVGSTCVADPATMRRQHMTMLRHQRDATVHGGIRGTSQSLKACITCHASPVTGSVAKAPGDFCVSCHSYASVQIDCFECHTSRPASATGALARQP